ncbi:MAG: hypothetical protein AB1805_03115 [Nitrospirota bacterium]
MDFNQAIRVITRLLTAKNPDAFNSSWILAHAPECYRYIHKNVRTELGYIDWDRVTSALPRKFQRRWVPARISMRRKPYEDCSEVTTILNKYQEKLYVFDALMNEDDRRIRDSISIALVRLAQHGNISARQEILERARHTIDDWIERYRSLARWQGYNEEIQKRLEACIRCYRYSGSFIKYVFLTLVYAGRGLRPLYTYSLDDPIAFGSEKRRVENVFKDERTNEIRIYKRTDHRS